MQLLTQDESKGGRREVSVYLGGLPSVRGGRLMLWQWSVYAIAAISAATWLTFMANAHAPLQAFLGVFVIMRVACHLVGFPTPRNPLSYIKYLRQHAPIKPPAAMLAGLADGAMHVVLFGEERVAICCESLPASPTLDDEAVRRISRMLAAFNGPLQFIVTTGRPECDGHEPAASFDDCLITALIKDSAEETAGRLVAAALDAGLKLITPDSSIFDARAGHGRISNHFIVEQLPYSMAIGWLGDLASLPYDFTTTVSVEPADREAMKIQAKKTLSTMSPRALMPSALGTIPDCSMQFDAVIRQAARDLLDGRTIPFHVSVDITISAKSQFDSLVSEGLLRMLCTRRGAHLKLVRRRALPFLAAFREAPVVYRHTVTEAAAVGCCPFFMGKSVAMPADRRRSEFQKLWSMWLWRLGELNPYRRRL